MEPRYLVAWSGDRHSDGVLAWAAVVARSLRAGLDIVYVQHVENGLAAAHPGEHGFEQTILRQAKERMSSAAAALGDDLDVVLHTFPAPTPAEGILEVARRLGSAMVVMGGDHGINLPIAQSVPGLVLRDSPVPVALVPQGRSIDPRGRLSEVVCCVGARRGALKVLAESVEGVVRSQVPLRVVSLLELEGHDRHIDEADRRAVSAAVDEAIRAIGGEGEVTTFVARGSGLSDVIDQVDWRPDSVVLLGASRLAPPGRPRWIGPLAARAASHLPVPMIVVPSAHR